VSMAVSAIIITNVTGIRNFSLFYVVLIASFPGGRASTSSWIIGSEQEIDEVADWRGFQHVGFPASSSRLGGSSPLAAHGPTADGSRSLSLKKNRIHDAPRRLGVLGACECRLRRRGGVRTHLTGNYFLGELWMVALEPAEKVGVRSAAFWQVDVINL